MFAKTAAKAAMALGFAGAVAGTLAFSAAPASAQGFYFDAPGVHVGVGVPHHRHYYGRYYDYSPGYVSPYYSGPCRPGFTVQDGMCKPYRGY
jgi:hypothetical protein